MYSKITWKPEVTYYHEVLSALWRNPQGPQFRATASRAASKQLSSFCQNITFLPSFCNSMILNPLMKAHTQKNHIEAFKKGQSTPLSFYILKFYTRKSLHVQLFFLNGSRGVYQETIWILVKTSFEIKVRVFLFVCLFLKLYKMCNPFIAI